MSCDSFITGDCPTNKPGQGAGGGGGGATALNDLTDVNTAGAIEGQVLKLQSGVWVGADDETGGGANESASGSTSYYRGITELQLTSPADIPASAGNTEELVIPFDTTVQNTASRSDLGTVNSIPGIFLGGASVTVGSGIFAEMTIEPIPGETPFDTVQIALITLDSQGSVLYVDDNEVQAVTPGDPVTISVTVGADRVYDGHVLAVAAVGVASGVGVPTRVTAAHIVAELANSSGSPILDMQGLDAQTLPSNSYTQVRLTDSNSSNMDASLDTGIIQLPLYNLRNTMAINATFTPTLPTTTITEVVVDLVFVGSLASQGIEYGTDFVMARESETSSTQGATINMTDTVSTFSVEAWSGVEVLLFVRALTDDGSDVIMSDFSITARWDTQLPVVASIIDLRYADTVLPDDSSASTSSEVTEVIRDDGGYFFNRQDVVSDSTSGLSAIFIEAILTPQPGEALTHGRVKWGRRTIGDSFISTSTFNNPANNVIDEVVPVGDAFIDFSPNNNVHNYAFLNGAGSTADVTDFHAIFAVQVTTPTISEPKFNENDAIGLLWQGV